MMIRFAHHQLLEDSTLNIAQSLIANSYIPTAKRPEGA